jgi:hypothetical protein
MSLDVEGFEAQVLAGLDFDRHAPRYLLVEQRDRACSAAVAQLLAGRYRRCEQLSPHDVLYARSDQPDASELDTGGSFGRDRFPDAPSMLA